MAIKTVRSLFRTTGPSWLRTGNALAVLHSIGAIGDLITEMALQAVARRFPGAPLPDALETLGQERGILRGPDETPAHYATRLRNWRQVIPGKGNPYTMLTQLHEYFEQWGTFQIDLVYAKGRRYIKDAAGAITYDDDLVGVWEPPTPATYRWYLFMRPAVDFPIDDTTLRNLVTEWNAQHCLGNVYVLYGNTHVWGEPGLVWGATDAVWAGEDDPRELKDIN